MLQNLEPSTISRQYATLLLDAALEQCKWELSKDLVRFLRAIGKLTVLHKMYLITTLCTFCDGLFVIADPNDVESPRASFILSSKYGVNPQTPPVSPNEEDLSLVLGTMQVCINRYRISMQFVWKQIYKGRIFYKLSRGKCCTFCHLCLQSLAIAVPSTSTCVQYSYLL